VTISCVYHPPPDDASAWYELTHVYVPATACPELLEPARDALLAAADARFEAAPDEARAGSRKLKMKKLSDSKGIKGEITDVAKAGGRGSKTQGGRMCMYGAHSRRASGPSEKVPGKAEKWPDHYNPSGVCADVDSDTVMGGARHGAMQAVAAHAGTLERLETALLPEAGAARRAIADGCDPNAEYRVASKSAAGERTNSTGMSLSLTHGYVVCMHNDSGAALEAIGFAYKAESPLPSGHELLFAVAGCIHPLPVDRDGFVFVAVRGEGVYHGTLPTSSTEPHFADHAGVGSALVNKADLVQLLAERGELGQKPWPTPEELKARREEVAAQKNEGGLAKALRDLAAKQRASEDAQRELVSSLQSAAEAVGDAAGDEAGEGDVGSSSAQGERDAARQAIHAAERQTADGALDMWLTKTDKARERLQAMAGLLPLTGDGEAEAAAEADPEAEENPAAAAEGVPKTREELLVAIADPVREYGLLKTAVSTLATPAFKALKAICAAKGVNVPAAAAEHKKGQPLPDGFSIVKVSCRCPTTVRLAQPYSCSQPPPSRLPPLNLNCKAGPALQLLPPSTHTRHLPST
jgi:hypothetical protein